MGYRPTGPLTAIRQRERARDKWGTRTHHWKQCTQPTTLEFGLPIMFLKSGIGLQLVDSHRNGVLLGALKAMDLFGFSDQGQFSVNGQRADVSSSRMR